MTRQEKEEIHKIEEYLNERWFIANEVGLRNSDKDFYDGCLGMLKAMGYTYTCSRHGVHKVWLCNE